MFGGNSIDNQYNEQELANHADFLEELMPQTSELSPFIPDDA